MPEAAPGFVWTTGQLLEKLQQPAQFFILDVRDHDAFERFRLEGRGPLPTVNIPYFELLETGGKDDMVESIMASVGQGLDKQLPKDRPILAVCAKGGTSEYVMRALRQLSYDSFNLQGGMKAWSEHYAVHVIAETPALAIYQVSRSARGCLSYVIASDGQAILGLIYEQ